MTYDEIPERLLFFSQLLQSACGMSTWCYDIRGNLLHSNCTSEQELSMFFLIGSCLERVISRADEYDDPYFLNDDLGMLWIADYAKNEGTTGMIFVIGPMFNMASPVEGIRKALRGMNLSVALTITLMEKLEEVPVLQMTSIGQYALMLHYTITGTQTHLSKFHLEEAGTRQGSLLSKTAEEPEAPAQDVNRVVQAEMQIMQQIRDGNPNYRAVTDRYAAITIQDTYNTGDPLRDGKDTVIIFTASCCRAAIEGGLSAKIAKGLEVYYISSAEKCKNMSELANVTHTVIEDYTMRVHKCKAAAGCSVAIQECCDYINTHLTDSLELKTIAHEMGYAEYYLTRKFRREKGVRMLDYIRQKRLEHAAILLRTTGMTIQAISDELGFGTRNYFTKIFKEMTGLSPVEYRERPNAAGRKEGK